MRQAISHQLHTSQSFGRRHTGHYSDDNRAALAITTLSCLPRLQPLLSLPPLSSSSRQIGAVKYSWGCLNDKGGEVGQIQIQGASARDTWQQIVGGVAVSSSSAPRRCEKTSGKCCNKETTLISRHEVAHNLPFNYRNEVFLVKSAARKEGGCS